MKKNPIDALLMEQGFSKREAEVFEDILKFARASQASPQKLSLKNFIKNKIDMLTEHENKENSI